LNQNRRLLARDSECDDATLLVVDVVRKINNTVRIKMNVEKALHRPNALQYLFIKE